MSLATFGFRGLARATGDVGLFMLFGLFAFANFMHWREGRAVGLGACAWSLALAVLFVVRRRPLTISGDPVAWVAAPVGTFTLLLARPDPGSLSVLGEVVQFFGVAVAFAAFGTLGRSFGLVAANRGIKTGGLYRLVRHPVYTGELVMVGGYLLGSPTTRNAVVAAVTLVAQVVRLGREEAVLVADPEYSRYRQRVRYRLLPLIY